MVATLEQATGEIGSDLVSLEKCIRDALNDYVTEFAENRHKLSKRSQASIIHDLVVRRCEAAFGSAKDNGGTEGVHRAGNRRLVLFRDGQYQIKLKKLDGKRRTRNIPTQAVLRFVRQEAQLTFEQTPAPTNLHAGYQIVKAASLTASRVWIVCPSGSTIRWEAELTSFAPTEAAKPSNVEQLNAEQAQPPRRARVKPEAAAKRSKVNKTSKAGGDDDGRPGAG